MTAVAQVFDYNGIAEIRTVVVNHEPWFVAADVARLLGYRMASDMTRRLDEDDRGTRSVRTPSGQQDMTVISEAGLYAAILGSKVPGARDFKRWVTHEVLPAIRRTGRYEAPNAPVLPQTYAEALRELANTVEARDAAQARLAIAAPKAEYVDEFVTPDEDTSLIRVFAAQLGVGEKVLRAWLVDRKVIYRRIVGQRWSNSQQRLVPEYEWLAYADYRPWFRPVDQPTAPRLHNGQTATTLYVTPVGKVGIRRLLMQHPIELSP